MRKCGYAGNIKNSGTQHVQAPFKSSGKAKPVTKKGGDLRVGSKGGK